MKQKKGPNWTEEELLFVESNYLEMSHREMGEKLGRSPDAVKNKCKQKRWIIPKKYWSGEEDDYIRDNYQSLTASEIATKLGRTNNAIVSRAGDLGIKSYKPFVSGDKINNLLVTSDEFRDEDGDLCVLCECLLCGNKDYLAKRKNIIAYDTYCCGCTKRKFTGKRKKYKERPRLYPKFMTDHKLYSVWMDMKSKSKGGGVCEEWEDYITFFKFAKPIYKEGYTFYRPDKTKLYSPENILVVTQGDLVRNRVNLQKENGELITYEGLTVTEWADKLDIDNTTLRQRVNKYGWKRAVKLKKKISGLELLLEDILKKNNINYTQQYKVKRFVADFYLPDYDIVLEADGLYFHSDKINTPKNYHKRKRNTYLKHNLSPLFFRENEIKFQSDIIESIILNKIGKSKRIFARKCEVKEITKDEAKVFCQDNHLMGSGRGRSFGLFYEQELISVARVVKLKGGLDISRFCHKIGYSVIGGFSKILKNIERSLDPDFIQTFIDLRYGSGEYLSELGFTKETESLSFVWFKQLVCLHRMKFPGNSGYDHGYYKIWDCGQAKWVKQLK